MELRILYENSVNAHTSGPGAESTYLDISDRVRAYTFDVTQNAEEGSVAISQMTVEDPLGELDIVGWRRIFAFEQTATSSNSAIYGSWVYDKTIHRGPFRTLAGRVWDVNLADDNALLEFRIMNGSDANRPAETDVQRIQWLMSTSEMNRMGDVTTYVDTTGGKAMDAVDYRGQRCADIANDCAQASGKNYFTFLTQSGAGGLNTLGTAFWYGFDNSTLYSSPLRLTNVLAEIDNNFTFAIAMDTHLTRDPSRVYSGVYLPFDGGSVYEELASTSNNFTRRDVEMDGRNVKTAAKASARALRYLNDLDTEEDRIETALYLPATKVNFVKVGMRVQVKATHLPGYTDYTWMRVLRRQVRMDSEGPDQTYLVSLTLSTRPASTSCPVVEYTQTSGVTYGVTVNSLPSVPTVGCSLQIWVEQIRGAVPITPIPPTGFTTVAFADNTGSPQGNGGTVFIAYRVTQAGDTGSVTSLNSGQDRAHVLYEFRGITGLTSQTDASNQADAGSITSGSISLGTGQQGLLIGAFIKGAHGPAGGNTLPNLDISTPATRDFDEVGTLSTHDQGPTLVVGYRLITATSGSYSMTATGDTGGFANGTWAYVLAGFTS